MKTAIVTGGNRGIGFEVSKQLAEKGIQVILTSRDPKKGEKAAAELKNKGLNVISHVLDVSDDKSVEALRGYVEKNFGSVDIIVNNAGILVDDEEDADSTALNGKTETILQTFNTNTLGAFRMCKAFIPMMRKKKFGRIVNISSGMGQLSDMNGAYPAYRISKTALNAVTRIFADECSGQNILINSVCPGWVKTDMGGAGAERPVSKGAETPVWAATLPDGGPTGGFFRDKEPIEW